MILSENYLRYVRGVWQCMETWECVKKEELHENRKKKNSREWKEEATHENENKKRTGKYKRKFKFLRF